MARPARYRSRRLRHRKNRLSTYAVTQTGRGRRPYNLPPWLPRSARPADASRRLAPAPASVPPTSRRRRPPGSPPRRATRHRPAVGQGEPAVVAGLDARPVRRWRARHHGPLPDLLGQQHPAADRLGLPPGRSVPATKWRMSTPLWPCATHGMTSLWFLRRFLPSLWISTRAAVITRRSGRRAPCPPGSASAGGGSSSGAIVNRSSTPQTSQRYRTFTLRISPGGGGGGSGWVSDRSMAMPVFHTT